MKPAAKLVAALSFAVIAIAAQSQELARGEDWPQWRGPARTGKSAETLSLKRWPADGAPRVLWRAQVGKGHSAAAVHNGKLYTAGWDGEKDTVYCLDAASGEVLWRQSYPCETIVQWPGPRATPTVEGSTVYTLGQWGDLRAWNAETGRPVWERKLKASYNPDIDYGFAWSPLIVGDLLILAAGQRGLALHKATGEIAWGDDGQHGACASPVPFVLGGQQGVAIITTNPGRDSVALVGVEPRTGQELWRSPPWIEKWGAACVDLLFDGNQVFVTTAEQHLRCGRFSVQGKELREDWSSKDLACYTGGCVLIRGHVFAVDKRGILKCLDWESGKMKWLERGFGEFGAISAAGDKLLIMASDSGELAVVEGSAEKYLPLRRSAVFEGEGRTFTVPVLSHGRIYCRSYAGELVCLDVAAGE